MDIIDSLKGLRIQKKLTQSQLAARVGATRLTIQRLEARTGDPKLGTVEEVARALGVQLLVVPHELTDALEGFIRAGGRSLAQPVGVDAPKSIVDSLGS